MKNKYIVIALLLGVGLTLTVLGLGQNLARANGSVLYVNSSGSCGGASPCYTTVQEAVDDALDGDQIRVATAVYTDLHACAWNSHTVTQVVFLDKSLTIRGGYTIADWSVPDPVANPATLDARGQGRVFYVTQSHTVTLEGLHIVNGTAPGDGGAIYAEPWGSNLTIRACDILSSTNTGSGGGAISFELGFSNPGDDEVGVFVLQDNRLAGNAGYSGGALVVSDAVVTMTNNLFVDNVGPGGAGGAYIYHCASFVADNLFQNNEGRDGGGLYAAVGELALIRNTFLDNTANGMGGGLNASVGESGLTGVHTYTIAHNLFQGNRAGLNSFNVQGGGARLSVGQDGLLLFHHNQVLNNVALACQDPTNWYLGQGGGVWVDIMAYENGQAVLADNLIQGNWATDSHPAPPRSNPTSGCVGSGGGVWVRGVGTLERNRIIDNRAAYHPDFAYYLPVFGGGVYIHPGSMVTITNNIIAENRAFEQDDDPTRSDTYSDGGALYIGGQTTPAQTGVVLLHNTIANNQSPALANESAAITMSHCIMAGHTTDLKSVGDRSDSPTSLAPTTTGDYTLWYTALNAQVPQGTFVHTHDFTGDPRFIGAALDAYHLGNASAAIDKGPGTGVASDIDGHPRPIYNGYDLGADEYVDVNLAPSTKSVNPQDAIPGEQVTFTVVLRNSGAFSSPHTLLLDAIPAGTTYIPGSLQSSTGAATDAGAIGWTGDVWPNTPVTISFRVTIDVAAIIQNTAVITDGYGAVWQRQAWVNAQRIYLPLVLRQ